MDLDVEAIARKHADELRDCWQARALSETQGTPLFSIVLSVLAHNFDDSMEIMLRVVFPGFTSILPPFLSTAGKISKSGAIVADVVDEYGVINLKTILYKNEIALRDDFRRLADALKLSDSERSQMFKAVQRWVVCDYRLDPTMDPKDPDARRLILH